MEAVILNAIQPLLVSLVTIAIGIVTTYAAKWLKTKTGIELSQAATEEMQNAATTAVLAAEEKGCAAATKWAGAQKLNFAVELLMKMVPKITPEQADNLVHSAIAKIPALGASGDLSAVDALKVETR
jgi:hypothetical protein